MKKKDSNSNSKEEENSTNFYSTNNTLSKEVGRCESILKENPNPHKLSFLNQKQDSKDFLKQQLNNNLKPNDNIILNVYSAKNQIDNNLVDVGLFSDIEADTFLSKSNQTKVKNHSFPFIVFRRKTSSGRRCWGSWTSTRRS